MAIIEPDIDANNYFVNDDVAATPKHGTTIQAGWDAINSVTAKPKREAGNYPTDLKFTEKAQLVRFLSNEPFAVYQQHWVQVPTENGAVSWRSFVALGEDDPLTVIAGLTPRPKAAFNVLNLSLEEPEVQILTASVSLAKQLQAANEDPRRGPLSKWYWAISRQGTGRETQYTVDRVRASELAEEWDLDPEEIDAIVANAPSYDATAIYVKTYEEHLKVARQLVGNGAN
jgi:hypothetical protein